MSGRAKDSVPAALAIDLPEDPEQAIVERLDALEEPLLRIAGALEKLVAAVESHGEDVASAVEAVASMIGERP